MSPKTSLYAIIAHFFGDITPKCHWGFPVGALGALGALGARGATSGAARGGARMLAPAFGVTQPQNTK